MLDGFAGNMAEKVYPSSVTLFIVGGLAVYAVIKYLYGLSMNYMFNAFLNYRQSQRLYEERRISDRRVANVENLLYALSIGIFFSLTMPVFGMQPLWGSFAATIAIFSTLVGLFYAVKSLIWRVLGFIFKIETITHVYIYNMYLYNRITGLLIFPFIVIIPYIDSYLSQYVVYTIISITLISYTAKIRRIFQIILEQNVPIYYFILYLCTLEFLPLLLLIKCCIILSVNLITS